MTRKLDTVGIVGAGQLARMSVQAAIALGADVHLLAARPDDSAALVWPRVTVGSPDSIDALRRFAAACDVLTFDHELVDPTHLATLEVEGHNLRPSAGAQLFAQDKGEQRRRFAARGLPVPEHAGVGSAADLITFGEAHGWPVVAKARRGGYDGRGVWVLDSPRAASDLVDRVGSVHLLAERWLPIEMELAVLLARRPEGETVVYPVVQTVQLDGICHEVIAPAPIDATIAAQAERLARMIAEITGVVGILAVELFVVQGRLSINEIATRPHNSGHYSIEGAVTSQFENHLRAVLDWPLGDTRLAAPAAVMVNVLGPAADLDLAATLPAALAVSGAHIHLYGKQSRPGRKLGHITALGDTADEARSRARRAAAILTGKEPA